MTKPKSPPDEFSPDLSRQVDKMTRRGFAWGGIAVLAGFAGWKWLGSRNQLGMLPWPLRRLLEFDERITSSTFQPGRMSREYPASYARMPRLNGRYGVDPDLDQASWRLKVVGPAGSKTLTIADIKALPRVEVTTELRCIEGWSEIVTWGGTRLVDLASSTGLARRSGRRGDPLADPADLLPYASFATPDKGYYVGLDIASALHSQTLLCYEMNGEPLQKHRGAPLRLAIPVKYGIKSLKQIGTIQFAETKPSDFWATKGYDWYAGL
jgi:DMSO/TMAO reductase YedYZ molybdopterin-dependent catalytic subunit